MPSTGVAAMSNPFEALAIGPATASVTELESAARKQANAARREQKRAAAAQAAEAAAKAEAEAQDEAERLAWNTLRWIPTSVAREIPARKTKGGKTLPAMFSCSGRKCRSARGGSWGFATIVELVDHLANEEGFDMHSCEECGDQVWERRFADHVNTDHEHKPHWCTLCQSLSALPHRRHCHCGQWAEDRDALERHGRRTGHHSFVCMVPDCAVRGQGFRSREHLKRHQAEPGHPADPRRTAKQVANKKKGGRKSAASGQHAADARTISNVSAFTSRASSAVASATASPLPTREGR
eukprot:m.177848 g.177848  ORF g.177848 m.177848 type:complete len:296 (-) comp17972_c2_seq1:193-1080(-)